MPVSDSFLLSSGCEAMMDVWRGSGVDQKMRIFQAISIECEMVSPLHAIVAEGVLSIVDDDCSVTIQEV